MFEAELADKFKQIFQVTEVSYDTPGESQEQNVLFVEVENPKFTFKDGRALAIIKGNAVMFGRNDALTFGFFAKAISQADDALTKDLFFEDFETNTQRFRDIVQRGFSFTYFFNSQYDPDVGTIEELDITIEEF